MEAGHNSAFPTRDCAGGLPSGDKFLGIHDVPLTKKGRAKEGHITVDQGALNCSCKEGRLLKPLESSLRVFEVRDYANTVATGSAVGFQNHGKTKPCNAIFEVAAVRNNSGLRNVHAFCARHLHRFCSLIQDREICRQSERPFD
jgi:hypothetical protein